MTAAGRLRNLGPQFFAGLNRRLAELQAAGCDVIRLDVGSPDLPPPAHVIEALSRAAAQPDRHGYQPHSATPGLRRAWAGLYERLYEVKLDSESQVLPLMGSKEGIFHLALALLNPGDIVLAPDPGYMTYTRGAQISGGVPYMMPLRVENNYLPDFDLIPEHILARARLLWLNYPNNPTGAVAGLDFFHQAVEFARRHNLLVCHDAAYAQVTFDGYTAPSLLQVPGAAEVAVEFNTLSKSHNMAGWRVGAALGNAEALRSLFAIKSNADSGHFLPVLEAAEAAINGDQSWIPARNERYARRRDILVEALQATGWETESPKAALYVWAAPPPGWEPQALAQALLEEVYVSVTPGEVFGDSGNGHLRFAFTTPSERLREAVNRLHNFFERSR